MCENTDDCWVLCRVVGESSLIDALDITGSGLSANVRRNEPGAGARKSEPPSGAPCEGSSLPNAGR